MQVVLTTLSGVAPYLQRELARTPAFAGAWIEAKSDTELTVEVSRNPTMVSAISGLRTAVAAYLPVTSAAPRPLGLVSSEAIAQLDDALETIAWQRPRVRFSGLRVEAAGRESEVMTRLAATYAERAGVPVTDDGDLQVRVRRSGPGWQALIRMSPRPLATRSWRTERYPGAVNATIAAAVIEELGVSPTDRFADLMVGSGTLVIERMARGKAHQLVAVDASSQAMEVLERHLRAARQPGRVRSVEADVASVGFGDDEDIQPGSFTHLVANPPWGELLGDHEANETLYPTLLDAVDRLGTVDVRAGVLTHDIARFERVLAADPRWRVAARPQFFAKGHRPRLFVLQRSEGSEQSDVS